MHPNHLVRLAAEIADRFGQTQLSLDWPAFDLEAYWTVSQSRRERWRRKLVGLESRDYSRPENARRLEAVRTVIDEILTSEVLTRVWTATYESSEIAFTSRASVSAVRSVWLGHQEMRSSVLKILNAAVIAADPSALYLNRLRRKTERWSDVLLAHLGGDPRYLAYAVDRERVRDFRQNRDTDEDSVANNWSLFLASLRNAFPIENVPSANPDLNAEIHESINGIMPNSRALATADLARPLFTDRVWQRLEDTSRQMDDWLESYLF